MDETIEEVIELISIGIMRTRHPNRVHPKNPRQRLLTGRQEQHRRCRNDPFSLQPEVQ
jgi:hypothetical protein